MQQSPLPYENANFALQCPDVEFAMIANADHVPQLQRRKETMNLFTAFLKEQSIQNIDGIIPLDRQQMQDLERRGEERIQVSHPKTRMSHRLLSKVIDVEVVDINYFGVLFNASSEIEYINQHARDLALHLEDEEGEFKVECLIFEATDQGVRALFKHGYFEVADRLLKFITHQKNHIAEVV